MMRDTTTELRCSVTMRWKMLLVKIVTETQKKSFPIKTFICAQLTLQTFIGADGLGDITRLLNPLAT